MPEKIGVDESRAGKLFEAEWYNQTPPKRKKTGAKGGRDTSQGLLPMGTEILGHLSFSLVVHERDEGWEVAPGFLPLPARVENDSWRHTARPRLLSAHLPLRTAYNIRCRATLDRIVHVVYIGDRSSVRLSVATSTFPDPKSVLVFNIIDPSRLLLMYLGNREGGKRGKSASVSSRVFRVQSARQLDKGVTYISHDEIGRLPPYALR